MGWNNENWIMLLLMLLVIILGLGFVLGSSSIMAYMYWPISYSKLAIPAINTNAKHIMLIAHGIGDTASNWSDTLQQTLQQQFSHEDDKVQVISLDWNPYSTSSFRYSVDGKRIGALLAEKILVSAELKSLHLIGHSCGSFVFKELPHQHQAIAGQIS
ncbi:MAG TPA: hypothetical protein ENI05_14750 [Porticoccus sp.]|nr:hypothetical protein [Porticoccus sp.]